MSVIHQSVSSAVRPQLDAVKIIAFEAEPNTEKSHYTYTVVFSIDRSSIRWKVTHQFSRFKVLNLLIRKLAPKLIYSKFPKDSTTTLLGLRLSKKAVDNRRLMLDIWIREVVANSEIFPEEIVQSLNDFIKAPKKVTTVIEKKSIPLMEKTIEAIMNNPTNITTPNGKKSSDSNHLSINSTLDKKKEKDTPLIRRKKKKFEVIVRYIARVLKNIAVKVISIFNSSIVEKTTTICLSRTQKLFMKNNNEMSHITNNQVFKNFTLLTQLFIMITIVNKTASVFLCKFPNVFLSANATILVTSIIMYIYLLSSEYTRQDELLQQQHTPQLFVAQETLRKFLNTPTIEYTDEFYAFPTFRAYHNENSPSPAGSVADSSEADSYSSDELSGSVDTRERTRSPDRFNSANNLMSSSHDRSEKLDRPSLHESLVLGSRFVYVVSMYRVYITSHTCIH